MVLIIQDPFIFPIWLWLHVYQIKLTAIVEICGHNWFYHQRFSYFLLLQLTLSWYLHAWCRDQHDQSEGVLHVCHQIAASVRGTKAQFVDELVDSPQCPGWSLSVCSSFSAIDSLFLHFLSSHYWGHPTYRVCTGVFGQMYICRWETFGSFLLYDRMVECCSELISHPIYLYEIKLNLPTIAQLTLKWPSGWKPTYSPIQLNLC